MSFINDLFETFFEETDILIDSDNKKTQKLISRPSLTKVQSTQTDESTTTSFTPLHPTNPFYNSLLSKPSSKENQLTKTDTVFGEFYVTTSTRIVQDTESNDQ